MFGTFLSIMVFVTDCDNTLVHYDLSEKSNGGIGSLGDSYMEHDLITMPASSGSGRVASVSALTVKTLDEISKEDVNIICATGMRATTMLQREKYFPCIKYWACENGGRIFCKENESELPSEIIEYSEIVSQRAECKEDLAAFVEVLRQEGWDVDDNGYLSMVRVRGSNFEGIVERIPSTLQHTFNLGHLDVQYNGCSKLAAVEWIIKNRLSGQKAEDDKSGELPFFFMGDDDNDIEVASQSMVAFITKPCSDAMQKFIDQFEQKETGVQHIFEAPFLRHLGTEAMLALALDMIRAEKASPGNFLR